MSLKVVQTAGLLLVGFVGALFGMSAYAGTSLQHVFLPQQSFADARSSAHAGVCAPDTKSEEDEVFFLGCGGIF